MPPYRRALVIANPVSGRGQGARAARELEEGLSRLGVPTELFLTTAPGDAYTRLRSETEGVDLVLAVGGDGTLSEVFEGLLDPEIAVGLVPYGTANVLATELKLPRDVHHALEIVTAGKVTPIDVAAVNGHLSFLCVGVGLDALAVQDVTDHRDGPITKWRYVGAVLRTLRRYRPPRLTVEVDGEPVEGEHGFVVASNVRGYGGVLHLAPDARIDDGSLEVYLFPTGRLPELIRAFARGFFRHLPGGAVTMRRGRRVRITSPEPVPYQVDGDHRGDTPIEVQVADRCYRVLAP